MRHCDGCAVLFMFFSPTFTCYALFGLLIDILPPYVFSCSPFIASHYRVLALVLKQRPYFISLSPLNLMGIRGASMKSVSSIAILEFPASIDGSLGRFGGSYILSHHYSSPRVR